MCHQNGVSSRESPVGCGESPECLVSGYVPGVPGYEVHIYDNFS